MRRLAPGLAALAGLLACGAPEGDLARAVRDYDDALVKAYAGSNPSGLPRVAGLKESNRIRVLIDLKTNAGLALESTLESLEVTRAEASGERATVETRERWRYHDRRLTPGAPPGPELLSAMAMRYTLLREEGRWKVESVSTISNDYLGPTVKSLGVAAPDDAARAPSPSGK